MERGWGPARWLLAIPLAGLLGGCVTQQDLLEQDRKLTDMMEQQSRSVDAMRREIEQMRNDAARGRGTRGTPGTTRSVPKPTSSRSNPGDTTLPSTASGPPSVSGIGMTLSPEGQSREDAPVAETVVTDAGSTSAPGAGATAAVGAGLIGEAVAAPPPPTADPAVQRGAPAAADPEWRREVAQERAVAKATGGAGQREYVDALQGLEQGDCKKALARLKAASDQGGSLSDNAMYWEAKCLAARGSQRKAEARLSQVVNRYPKSDKAPAALWAQAELQQRSGDSSAARGTLSRLIKDYPASAEATRARKKLAELD